MMDLVPVPGLPLLTDLFCTTTRVKLKKQVVCDFPDVLFTKKAIIGGIPGVGLSLIELLLLCFFIFLSFKMKQDITKSFLSCVYIPLGLSSLFKLICGAYGVALGAYGWIFMACQTLYEFFYTTTNLTVAMGSIFFLCGMFCVARSNRNFSSSQMWVTFMTILFVSLLLSGSYHFVAQKWNQLPASAIFFFLVVSTVVIVIMLITGLVTLLLCKPSKTVIAFDPNTNNYVVAYARTRLGWALGFTVLINIPQWFDIYYKSVELFTPFNWLGGKKQKDEFYKQQRIELLTYDIVKLFLSLILLASMFVNSSSRFALKSWIDKIKNRGNKKVFVASQKTPLLQQQDIVNTEKAKEIEQKEKENIVYPTISNESKQINAIAPPSYAAGFNFSPGMLQFPHHVPATIVYTPPPGATVQGGVIIEDVK